MFQELHLKRAIDYIETSESMKHTKLGEFLAKHSAIGGDVAEYLRSKWRYNRFALVWGDDDSIQRSGSDGTGITSKTVRLECPVQPGNRIRREWCVVLEDYVQWRAPSTRMDALELDVHIPTIDSRVIVVIDRDLYKHTPWEHRPPEPSVDEPGRMKTNLQLELHNLEGAIMRLPREGLILGKPVSSHHPRSGNVDEGYQRRLIRQNRRMGD